MSKDKPKSNISTAAAGAPMREKDERGLAIWEWAGENGKNVVDAGYPLSVAEEALRVKGYSPYDSGQPENNSAPRKRKDLRKLGEWLKLKTQAAKSRSDP